MLRRSASGTVPSATTSETAKRPPGLSTRNASRSTADLSAALGAQQLLADLLPDGKSSPGQDRGTARRAARRDRQIRLLGEQRAAGVGALELCHQHLHRDQTHLLL